MNSSEKEANIDNELRSKVSQFSPEAQKNAAIEQLVTSNADSMFDLSDSQITTMSLFKTFDENVVGIPAVIGFLDKYASLSRSRDRFGRQEYAECHVKRPSYVRTQGQNDTVIESIPPSAEQQKNPSLWKKLLGGKK